MNTTEQLRQILSFCETFNVDPFWVKVGNQTADLKPEVCISQKEFSRIFDGMTATYSRGFYQSHDRIHRVVGDITVYAMVPSVPVIPSVQAVEVKV